MIEQIYKAALGEGYKYVMKQRYPDGAVCYVCVKHA